MVGGEVVGMGKGMGKTVDFLAGEGKLGKVDRGMEVVVQERQ